MKVLLAKDLGFCFGVEKAISKAIKTVENCKNVYSLGPLIHNDQVIQKLKEKGLLTIDNIDQIKNGKLIIRSHGVSLNLYNDAEKNNVEIIDCTCPFVRKIQKKVSEYFHKGYQIVIIGNPNHPEVIGINGWCNNKAYIINSEDDLDEMPKCDKICVVVQTTMTEEKFTTLSKLLSDKAKEIRVYNTICNATRLRQEACADLAKIVDAMIIIGGYHSSNTQKLTAISKEYCKNTFHIETINDLVKDDLYNFNIIGITAGASTPDWIIKEVIDKVNKNDNQMDKMMEEIEKTMVKLHRGDIVKGTVISVNENEVMVNIGYKSDGVIEKSELSNDPFINPIEFIKSGDDIEVYVIKLDDGEGNVLLSKKRVDSIKGWDELEEACENKEVLESKVVEVVKGGVIAIVKNTRGFIPASHIASRYVEDLNVYLGKTLMVRIIEIDKNKKRIVLSRKKVEKEELEEIRNNLWGKIEIGKKITGEVKRLTNFGAFVDIGGMDGLIHVSELSWGRVNHPSEVVNEGDKVEVIVLDFDKNKGKISLGLKQTMSHPWEKVDEKYKIGDIVEGTVVRLADFGVFVELEQGIDGLVHISQISHEHISKPSNVLSKGDKVKVKILDIKKDEQRISLSIKEAIEQEPEDFEQFINVDDDEVTIGDVMKINKQ